MPKILFTPETPVGATALAIFAIFCDFWQNVDKSWQKMLENMAWHNIHVVNTVCCPRGPTTNSTLS
jgi:hypothetical protein